MQQAENHRSELQSEAQQFVRTEGSNLEHQFERAAIEYKARTAEALMKLKSQLIAEHREKLEATKMRFKAEAMVGENTYEGVWQHCMEQMLKFIN